MSFPVAVFVLVALLGQKAHGQYNYSEALEKSLLFYEAQRSGKLPDTNRIPWRGDSQLEDLIPGGYYDAGDHVKFGFPAAFTSTVLAWGGITFRSGYEAANQLENLKECLQWFTDYFIAAHVDTNEFYGQIGDGNMDHAYWGRPEEMTIVRPAFKISAAEPGADLAGETSAALAAASIFYSSMGETALADESLRHARELFEFGDQFRGLYSDVIPAQEFYRSYDYGDELTWAALWLYKATGELDYLLRAEILLQEFGLDSVDQDTFGWGNKGVALHVLLFELTGNTHYSDLISSIVDHHLTEGTFTPQGLLHLSEWGSLASSSSLVHALQQAAALGIRTEDISALTKSQIDYMLGSTGRSFVVGFGVNYPKQPHHRGASCKDRPAPCNVNDYCTLYGQPSVDNGQDIVGALVGGPDANDVYVDVRSDYVHNEVALNYNSGYQGALAAIIAAGV